jgi:hypothetical protein
LTGRLRKLAIRAHRETRSLGPRAHRGTG